MSRVIAILVLLGALLPAAFLRDPPRAQQATGEVRFEALLINPSIRLGEGLRLTGAWRLTSPHPEFGSYSALVARPGGRLLAISDRGALLDFAPPGSDGARPRIALLDSAAGGISKRDRDAEAATADAASGRIWVSTERSNAIRRFGPGMVEEARAVPAAMRGWPDNRGAEAMVRLEDGRFILLGESRIDGDSHRALVFAGDPTEGAAATSFRYRPPAGFRPTDMAQLADGRVLILNRALLPPWRFRVKLTLADPARIARGRTWRGRELATIAPPLPADNYEGMAITPEADGAATIWLISDDNQAALVQRTLLLKLRWRPEPIPARAD